MLINEVNKVNNCIKCQFYYYFDFDDINNDYLCTEDFRCPINNNIYIPQKNKCINQ